MLVQHTTGVLCSIFFQSRVYKDTHIGARVLKNDGKRHSERKDISVVLVWN
jgi:hypothetical protein